MRKATTSLAVLALLFASATARTGEFSALQSHLETGTHLGSIRNAGSVAAGQLALQAAAAGADCQPSGDPVPPPTPNPVPPSGPGGLFPDHNADCNRFQHNQQASTDCSADCRPDHWGCRDHQRHRPGHSVFNSSEIALQATIVPVQVLATNTTTTSFGEQCQMSNAVRNKHEHARFEVTGNFTEQSYESQKKCANHENSFYTLGCEDSNEYEFEGEHDVDACECQDISAVDFLQFDNNCKCVKEQVDDPDDDITRRINKQIYHTISEVLSDIVQRSIGQCLEKTIDIE